MSIIKKQSRDIDGPIWDIQALLTEQKKKIKEIIRITFLISSLVKEMTW